MAEEKNKLPLGIKIISITFFIVVAFCFLYLLSAFFLRNDPAVYYKYTQTIFIFTNLVISFLFFTLLILGIFLWRRANWARILTIIFSFFNIIIWGGLVISALFTSHYNPLRFSVGHICYCLFFLLVFIYLIFDKKARRAFNLNDISIFEKILTGSLIFIVIFQLLLFAFPHSLVIVILNIYKLLTR